MAFDLVCCIHFYCSQAGVFRLFKTKYDWDFNAVKENAVNDREIYLCRGKVLGGSSSLNVLLYHRGNSEDYELWAKATGCEAWGPQQVLPYFKKSEDDYRGASTYHGSGGEFAVSEVRYQNPLSRAFLAACQEFKFQLNSDFNDWSHSQEVHLLPCIRSSNILHTAFNDAFCFYVPSCRVSVGIK